MHDFFRDELANAARVVGGWNSHSKNYVVSTQQERNTGNVAQNGQNIANAGSNVTVTLNATIGDIAAGDNIYKYTTSGQITGEFYGTIVSVIQTSNPASFVANLTNPIPALQTIICWTEPFSTVTFDEGVLGWTSFSSYKPNYSFSLSNVFYTFNTGKLYQHYLGNYAQFYGFSYDSDVTIILNSNPSVVKNFKTINYEGALGWELESMVASSNDKTLPIGKYVFQDNLASLETQIWSNTFKKKEDKYFANLINNSPAVSGEILYGADMSGIKGFYSTVKMKLNNSIYPTTKKELFSVSSDIVESSY